MQLNPEELLKTSFTFATNLTSKSSPSSMMELAIPRTSLTFSVEPLKSPEQIRIDDLESQMKVQAREILELKKQLKDERKNIDTENYKLRELTKFLKALQYLSELEEKITQTEEKVMNESISNQRKDVYSRYG